VDSPLEKLTREHQDRDAAEHLYQECPWFRHVASGGREHPDMHCRPAAGAPAGLHEGGAMVKFTPDTPRASTVVQPTVPPGGPGLFHMKGHHLPPYIEHLYPHLVERYGKHDAYGVAVGIVKKWAAGVNPGGWKTKSGKGKRTHPDVRAAASKNVAEWEKEKAEAHAHHGEDVKASVTAPGTPPQLSPGGLKGMYQNPVQAISPSPPLPPNVPMPTAAEVLAVIKLVPECSDKTLSDTAKKFLEQAAGKLSRDAALEALSVMRSAQAALYSAHKADLRAMHSSSMTANVFAVTPAATSSATSAMLMGRDQQMRWRKAEQALGALTDRIRKRFFHGVFNGPSQLGRFSEGTDMTALDRVLALAVVTGKDVSEPVTSDTSGATPLLQAPENLMNVTDPKAAEELASLPPLDRQRFDAYLNRARAMLKTNPSGAAQSALRAAVIAHESGARHLARHVKGHVQALADGGNTTHTAEEAASMEAGGKKVSPQNRPQTTASTGNGPWAWSAPSGPLDLVLAAAGSSAGKSAGSGAPRQLGAKPDAHQLHVEHLAHLHTLHVEHVEHLSHLHALHVAHMAHEEHQAAAGHSTGTPAPKTSTTAKPKTTAGPTVVAVRKPSN
jgi:hypothetical protein